MTQVPLPQSIRRAWVETDYRVRLPAGGHASIRCGRPLPPELLALLRYGEDTWGYLTAWNPGGVQGSQATNRIRQRRLRAALAMSGYRCRAGIGVGTRTWRESSLFITGIDYACLDALARRFGQLGVLRGTLPGPAELHELA